MAATLRRAAAGPVTVGRVVWHRFGFSLRGCASTYRLGERVCARSTGVLLRPNVYTYTHRRQRQKQRRAFSSTAVRRDEEHKYKDYDPYHGRDRWSLSGVIQRHINGVRTVLSARMVQALMACGLLGYILNLETVEETGRRRFNVVHPKQEASVGEALYRQYLGAFHSHVLPPHHPQARAVETVMDRLIPHVELEYVDWKVHVVNDDSNANAFVLPSGKVFVYTGLLPIAQDQNGLAVILGHEIAHVVAHHSAERLSSWWIVIAGVTALIGLFDGSGNIPSLFMSLFYRLPNSKTMESEADRIGLMLMAEACFDPNAAYAVWERLLRFEKENDSFGFLSTHPLKFNRLQDFRELMQEARTRYRERGCGFADRYMQGFKEVYSKSDRAVESKSCVSSK